MIDEDLDTFDHVTRNVGDGIERVARAAESGRVARRDEVGEGVKIRCRACGYLESEDAKFCVHRRGETA